MSWGLILRLGSAIETTFSGSSGAPAMRRWGRALAATIRQAHQEEETAWRASARNWSSLALIGPASIAGTPSVEKHDVLRPNLTCGRPERRNVYVRRYAP